MKAIVFDIIGRHRERPFALTDIKDFQLRKIDEVAAEAILHKPHVTLYSLDFENDRAVFVETPLDVDLSQAPFFFITQFETAVRVWTISFATMIALAKDVTIDQKRLVIVHSVGRSGSTLASQLFAQVPGVISLSEPDVLTILVVARHAQPANAEQLKVLLQASVCLLCKTPAETAWVLKGRSYIMEIGDWLHELFPQSKNLFLYRNAETWLASCLKAFSDGVSRTAAEHQRWENGIRAFKTPLIPAIAQVDAEEHLSQAQIMSIEWLAVMGRYVQFAQTGIGMLAIRYADWHAAPRKTAVAMLDYCQCKPDDMTAVYAALSRDSQAGTILSQNAVQARYKGITEQDLATLNDYLQNHAFIHEAGFEVANTLQV